MSKTRTLKEGRTTATLKVGERIPPLEFVLDPATVDFFIVAIDDRHPWHAQDSPFGGRIAPPTIATLLTVRATAAYLYGEWQPIFEDPANLAYVNESEYYAPLKVGERVRVEGVCSDRYERRGREFQVLDYTITGEGGRLLAKVRRTSLLDYRRKTPST